MRMATMRTFGLLALLLAGVVALGVATPHTDRSRGAPVFDEAISRSFTVVNRVCTTPVFDEAISRSFTVVNRACERPPFDEAISRAWTVCNSPYASVGDFDCDGDVDLDDFAQFADCYNGSARPPADTCPPGVDADLDNDGDVDLDDFAIFAANYTGSL